ncbi:MAG: chromate transporter [Syntrophobacteraceae bacterium]
MAIAAALPAENGEQSQVSPTTLDIVRVWLKIGTIGFGGGYAVLDLIHSELVVKHRWLTEQRFENMTALSEMAPGALTVNLLAGIAYRLGGVGTMIAATLALIFPSFLLIVALAGAFLAWENNPVVRFAMEGLTAGVVGLLFAVAWDMVRRIPGHWCCFATGIIALLLGLFFPVNPIWLVLLGGMAGAAKVFLTPLFAKNSESKDEHIL